MLNYFGNTNLVPNGYDYTSHTGSKYVFLEGLWFHNSSMQLANPKSYSNMYASAQKQIFEHNIKNVRQIGSTYLREGKEQMFIGNGQYTINGVLTESQFSDFKKADPNIAEIPNKFKLDDAVYNKNEKVWYIDGKRVNDTSLNNNLNQDALKKIQEYNKTDEFPVNSTINYSGKTLTWNGIGWVDESGRVSGDKFNSKVYDYLDENPQVDNATVSQEPKAGGIQKGATHTDKNGRQYVYDGSQFVSIDGKGTVLPNNDAVVQQYIDNKTTSSDGEGNELPKEQSQAAPKAGDVPDGFVYTSGKGKQYYKKGGEWYISGSKSKVNSSAARPLEQAAIKKINDLNASSDLKIGKSTWTSGSGKEYTYVGDDRFISADGKMLPKSMAAKVRDELTAKKDDHTEENSEIKDKVDTDIDDTSTATPEDRKEEEKQDQEQAIDDHDAKEDEHGEGEDKIKSIADKIKATDPTTARKITVLLTRADKLSLMAADIILSGEVDKVKQILQTLNNRDE